MVPPRTAPGFEPWLGWSYSFEHLTEEEEVPATMLESKPGHPDLRSVILSLLRGSPEEVGASGVLLRRGARGQPQSRL